jgi:pimeloyl-ACP methyl ester carboxylesterase
VPEPLPAALFDSPAGRRAAWVLERLAAMASGAPLPDKGELENRYTEAWLSEVPVAATFSEMAPLVAAATGLRTEPAPPNEARVVLEAPDGSSVRFRCVVQAATPYRIAFQLLSPAVEPSTYSDRVVRRDGRSVHVRDFGGDGPLLLLWHGAGCDASVWEAMVPFLGSFRVVAQDLPGHGVSDIAGFSVAEAISDAQAVVAELGLGEPLLVGHSMGGWAALHYAATNPCRALVGLDGPTSLDYAENGLQPDHHAFVPDPPDVATDLDALRCPTMIVLCRGSSEREAAWMVPFRAGLSDYLARNHPRIRVEWRSAGHILVVSQPQPTAELVSRFVVENTRPIPASPAARASDGKA